MTREEYIRQYKERAARRERMGWIVWGIGTFIVIGYLMVKP